MDWELSGEKLLSDGCMVVGTDSSVSVRSGAERALAMWQPGLWNALDCGVLLTDLKHVSLMCNRRFSEIFGVDCNKVVTSGVQELREKVIPFLQDPQGWLKNLEVIYADPYGEQRDEISVGSLHNRIERYTSPVFGIDGRPVARMWTFRKVDMGMVRELVVGGLTVDEASRTVALNGSALDLTKFEFDLLNLLAKNADTAMGREILFRRVWGYDIALNTNSLDVLISRLRRKLGGAGGTGVKIETVYGYGYRLSVG